MFFFSGLGNLIILLYFNARKYTSSVYLGIFFFLVSIYGLTDNSRLKKKDLWHFLPIWAVYHFPLSLLLSCQVCSGCSVWFKRMFHCPRMDC